ncbi:endonuclease I family protein [Streptomyces sp. ODS05-4]|uniref:endonuclease I family protein n=1 Tax=Streptomyces sp. ODS05-4 TaxID=2944939 RepID=UPI00210860B4|nr:endonuclease [Streptomyces sp. ODS05-4]
MSAHRRRPSWRRPTAAVAVVAAVALSGTAFADDTPPAAPPQPSGARAAALDDSYYQDALGKSGAELKSALHTIVSEQTTLSYDEVWEALKTTDEDPADPSRVMLIYSGRSQAKDAHGSGADDWNREHVWAKSHGDFGTAAGPGTDIHHLRPEDASVNSARGNLDFDEGGDPVDQAPGSLADADSFEPRDEVKGDVARMVLYMAVRYDGSGGFPDLEANDRVGNGSAPAMGRLSVLRRWSDEDPPGAAEKTRNDKIQQIQKNRNPFIDHPEWVGEIWT